MTVPCVTMHEVGVDVHGVEIGATPHRAERRSQRLWAREISGVQFEPDYLQITFLETLIAKTTHFDRHRFCQLPGQVTNVHARAAIDVRRILVSQEKDLHGEESNDEWRMSNAELLKKFERTIRVIPND